MGIGLLTNLPVGQLIVPDAFAELSSNPTITVLLGETTTGGSMGLDIDS